VTAKRSPIALVLALAALLSAAAGSFEEGERLFREDKPAEAALRLEKAVLEAGVDERAFLYLAVAYQQLGRLDEAAAVLRRGLPAALRFRHLFLFNLGNLFAIQDRNSFAVDSYTESLASDPGFAPAYLNRANARLAVKDYAGATEDYRRYLSLKPDDPQRPAIEQVLTKLDSAVAEIERAKMEAEAQRLAEEMARQAFLAQVAASLQAAADETTNLSAGSGEIQGYGDEIKLDD
jgi:colicin import membrane protein